MSEDLERKNLLGAVYDILIAGGSPTALGLAAIVGAAAAGGYGAYRLTRAVLGQIGDYLVSQELGLQFQLEKVHAAQAAVADMPAADETQDDPDKSGGAAMPTLERKMTVEDFWTAVTTLGQVGAGLYAIWKLTEDERRAIVEKLRGTADQIESAPPTPAEEPKDDRRSVIRKQIGAHGVYR